MKRALRILVGCILPPPLGVFALLCVNSTATFLFGEDPIFIGMDFAGMDFAAFWTFALFSYAIASTQAIAYSLLMEFVGQRLLNSAGTAAYLLLATLLGTLAGATLMEIKFALAGGLVGITVSTPLVGLSRP